MAGKVREIGFDSKAKRAKLKVQGKPYYRKLGPAHIGYRKSADRSKWVLRLYNTDRRAYELKTFALADDGNLLADGVEVLTFEQAEEQARALIRMPRGGKSVVTVSHFLFCCPGGSRQAYS